MPAVNRVTRRDLVTLLLVLFVAALMRLSEPGTVEFKLDEAWLSRIALEWVDGGTFPLTGMPSSVGLPNPPVSVYLIALPYAVSSNPLVATLFIAILNVIGVGLLWLIAHRYVGRNAALVAGLAYALNPWAVWYSRKIWAQDMHTPLVLLALLLGLLGFREGKRWAQLLCLPVLIVALQFHFAALALLPLYAVLLWMGRERVSWRAVGVSVLLAALTVIPFMLGLAQTLRDDARLMNTLQRGTDVELTADALRTTVELATGSGIAYALSLDDADDLIAAVPAQPQLWALLGVLALLGAFTLWQQDRRLAVLVLLWALLPLAAFTLEVAEAHPHYFIASIPAYALLIGAGLAWLIQRAPGKPFSRVVLLTGFIGIVLSQGVWWRGLLRYVAAEGVDDFGVPLPQRMPLRDALLAHDDVILLVDDARIEFSEAPAVWSVLLYEIDCFRALDSDVLRVLPDHAFTAVAAPGSPDALVDGYRAGDETRYDVPQDGEFKVYAHQQPMTFEDGSAADVIFSNQARLVGYAVNTDAVTLNWHLPDGITGNYHYFIHLLDANGERIAQHDAPFLTADYACPGDTVITRAPIPVPNEATTLRVGMYLLRGDQYINADVLDADGNPVGTWADIPLQSDPDD